MLTKEQALQKLLYTREQIEEALDKGQLYVAMRNGRYWKARRNGRTKHWVNKPEQFRIPIKYGFKNCGTITHDDIRTFTGYYVISETDPDPWSKG